MPVTSARERLLDAADALFYEHGVHVVGIDRVIEQAGVAKATLYSTFGSKDELVRAYLDRRHAARRARIAGRMAGLDDPRERILAVYDALADVIAAPGFRGCPFVNASAEARPGSAVEQATDEYRGWIRDLFSALVTETGAREPEQLVARLVLLYDGVSVSARLDRDPGVARQARRVAELLLAADHPDGS